MGRVNPSQSPDLNGGRVEHSQKQRVQKTTMKTKQMIDDVKALTENGKIDVRIW